MGIDSPVHLAFIAVIALVVLGPKRLPDLAKALGQGIREFRESLDLGASGAEPSPPPAASVVSAPSASSATPAPAPAPAATDATTPAAVAEIVAAAGSSTQSAAALPPAAAPPDASATAPAQPQAGERASKPGAE
jgi:TatA/E family protein of Tat protein translocase